MIELGTKSKLLPFDEAWLYCICLCENGYSDWHMPNYDEYYDCNMNDTLTGYGWVDDGTKPEETLVELIDVVIPVRRS